MDEEILVAELSEEVALGGIYDILSNAVDVILETNSTPNMAILNETDREARARNEGYYETTIPRYSDALFKQHFRMARSTCEQLTIVIGQAINGRKDRLAVLPKKVLFTIWILAKPESFLACTDRFGLAKATGYMIFKEILSALASLLSRYVKFPAASKFNQIARSFQRKSHGFPGIVAAVDGCQIDMKAPAGNPVDFYNRNNVHSVILQGTCNHKGRFVDVFIGMPGRMHDARVFQESPLYSRLNDEEAPLLPPHLHILGDSAYPLLKNLMKPYADNGKLTPKQLNFNTKLSAGRSKIERVFANLKQKLRRLKFLDVGSPAMANDIIAASCVLHNFMLIKSEDEFYDELLEDSDEDADVNESSANDNVADNSAKEKRDRIANMLM